MSFSKANNSRINTVPVPSCKSSVLLPMFPAAELLDEALTMYYLQNLPECRINVAKGLSLLYELEESEEQIYQAVALRSRGTVSVGRFSPDYSDQGMFRLQEDCDNEKRVIQNERTLLQNHIKNENHKIVILEGCIFSLPEPQRSVIISRYLERQPWPQIQQKLKRSASRIFSIHKEGIYAIHEAIRTINTAREMIISTSSSAATDTEKQ
ncbi:MAG: hypothetical protein WCG21_13835 [Eubacteriales bacterium]